MTPFVLSLHTRPGLFPAALHTLLVMAAILGLPAGVKRPTSAQAAGPAQVQGLAFQDQNHNGQRDSEEKGMANIKVQLLTAENSVAAEQTSAANGYYFFEDLDEAVYHVKFSRPVGYSFSPKDSSAEEALDSDVNPYTGESDPFTIAARGEIMTDLDAGLFEEPTMAWITGFQVEREQDGGIRLMWETGSEVDVVGFNIYRSTTADRSQETINPEPIFSTAPGSIIGAPYTYVDNTAHKDEAYYYWLELLRCSGPLMFGPVNAARAQNVVYLPVIVR
jgi:hypothetical protein